MISGRCTSHHNACDCREAFFEERERERNATIARLRAELRKSEEALWVCRSSANSWVITPETADCAPNFRKINETCAARIRAIEESGLLA